jgi:hypothetical protein
MVVNSGVGEAIGLARDSQAGYPTGYLIFDPQLFSYGSGLKHNILNVSIAVLI